MAKGRARKCTKPVKQFATIDQLPAVGMKQGSAKKDAIKKILHLVPGWRRQASSRGVSGGIEVAQMPEAPGQRVDKESRRLAAIDQMLLAAIQQGPAKKREAINRILELVPGYTRGDCWERIRHLRNNSGLDKSEGCCSNKAKKSRTHAAIPQSSGARWSPADDETLFRLAGYEPVNKIAQRLGRSDQAIRYRLGALGMSARVTDGWSLRALQRLLRVGPARLRYLIGNGILRVRDPRVRSGSLLAYCEENSASLDASALERIAVVLASSEDAFSWDRTADFLGLTLPQVQELISSGALKLVDSFVTDRSFEDFCKSHGSEINMALLDPPTAKWLRNEYGVPETATNTVKVSRIQKHALIIRTCVCGKTIAGNPYFRHIRSCRVARADLPTKRPNMLDSSS